MKKITFEQKALRNPNQEVTFEGVVVMKVALGWAIIYLDRLREAVGPNLDLDLAFQKLIKEIIPGNLNNCACFGVESCSIDTREREWFLSLAQSIYSQHCKAAVS